MSEDRSYLPLILIAILVLFSGKGGDSPSPTPDNVLAAKQAGVALLSGLADEIEKLEPTDNPSVLSKEMQEILKEQNNATIGQLNKGIFEDYDQDKAKRLLKDYATGFRGAVH